MQSPRLIGQEFELCTTYNAKVNALAINPVVQKNLGIFMTGPESEIVAWPGKTGFMTTNGGVIYDEVGDHLEYATPEFRDPIELVLSSAEFQKLILDALQEVQPDATINLRSFTPADVSKADTQRKSQRYASFACHENYEITRKDNDRAITLLIGLHVLTRTAFSGAGSVLYGVPRISGKIALHHLSRYTSLPGINLHRSHNEGYGRLEVRLGEDQPSDYAKILKIGSTTLLLDAIKRAGYSRSMDLYNSISPRLQSIVGLTNGIDVHKVVKMEHGRRYSLLNIQDAILHFVKKHTDISALTESYQFILEEWEKILHALDDGCVDPLDGRIDWLARLDFWEKNKDRAKANSFTHNDVCFTYDDLTIGRGVKLNAHNYARIGDNRYLVDPFEPPSDVACARAEAAAIGKNIITWIS